MKNSKLYLKITAVVTIPTITVLILRYLVRGNAGNWIVNFLQRYLYFTPIEAQGIYQKVIRNNLDYIIIAAIAVYVLILTVILVSYSRNQRAKDAKIAEQRKNELITYLAHDIRTPLTSVIGYLSLLDESPDMPNEQKSKYISIALNKANRLEGLVNQFFEITQYNFQTTELYQKEIDLSYMLVQLTDEAYPQLAAHGKKAVINGAENLTIYGDPDKLARAFNNILKNAIAYGDENSVIEITADIKDGCARIEFRNAGNIQKDKLLNIFDKFYRLDESRSSDTGGTGLGLAIAKEIITMHGGEISAESENGYTTFAIRLPENTNIKKTST